MSCEDGGRDIKRFRTVVLIVLVDLGLVREREDALLEYAPASQFEGRERSTGRGRAHSRGRGDRFREELRRVHPFVRGREGGGGEEVPDEDGIEAARKAFRGRDRKSLGVKGRIREELERDGVG